MYLAICDDDILLCANLRRKLAAFDTGGNKLFVDEYHSGEELLKGACRCNYDAVFLDLYMEGMSGFDTAKALAERKSEARIIFLTSNESLVFDSFESPCLIQIQSIQMPLFRQGGDCSEPE